MTIRSGMAKSIGSAVVLAMFGIAIVLMGTLQGRASSSGSSLLPPEGAYTIDPAHSFAYFGARHHIVGLVRGRFDKVTGTITGAKNLADCALNVSIDTASINTQITKRDDDLRGPDFFDVKNFPVMTYRGQGIRKTANSEWVMDGALTIRGVTKEVPLTFRFMDCFRTCRRGDHLAHRFTQLRRLSVVISA